MRVPRSHHDRQPLGVPMTPMIDVVFQLLVFFICTVNFQVIEELLPTSLASTGSTNTDAVPDEPELEHVIVKAEVRDDRIEWAVNDRPCRSLRDVQDVLHVVVGIDPSLPVILDVAPDVPLGNMIDVYDLCRIVGFERIQFAASRQ